MDGNELRAMQAPIKERYKGDPKAAVITLKAKGTLDDTNIACKVETGRALVGAGLHPATGGSGLELCSGDMLLEALVACAGVTVKAVATALDIPLHSRARSRRKAISISAARSASPKMRRSASRRFACASISTPMRRRTSSTSCSSSPSAIAWCIRPSRAGPPVEVKLAPRCIAFRPDGLRMPPDLYFALTLIVKMAVTAGFVVAATVTAERAGPVVGGLVATLPIGAGPVYVFLAIDHDAHFIAQSAIASLAINAANAIFAVVLRLLAQKRSLAVSLSRRLRGLARVRAGAARDRLDLLSAVAMNASCSASAFWLARSLRHVRMPAFHARWTDFLLRAVMVAMLVGIVVTFSFQLGAGRQRHSRGVSGGADQHHADDASARRRQGGGRGAGQCADRAGRLRLRLHGAAFHRRAARQSGGLALALVTSLGWSLLMMLAHRAAGRRADLACFSTGLLLKIVMTAAHRGGGVRRGRAQRAVHRRVDRLAADRGRRCADHSCLGASAAVHRRQRHRQHGGERGLRAVCAHLCGAGAAPLTAGEPWRRFLPSGSPPCSWRGCSTGARPARCLLNAVIVSRSRSLPARAFAPRRHQAGERCRPPISPGAPAW